MLNHNIGWLSEYNIMKFKYKWKIENCTILILIDKNLRILLYSQILAVNILQITFPSLVATASGKVPEQKVKGLYTLTNEYKIQKKNFTLI